MSSRYASSTDFLFDISDYMNRDISAYQSSRGPQALAHINTSHVIARFAERLDAPTRMDPIIMRTRVGTFRAEYPANKTAKVCITHTSMIRSRLFLMSRGGINGFQDAVNELSLRNSHIKSPYAHYSSRICRMTSHGVLLFAWLDAVIPEVSH